MLITEIVVGRRKSFCQQYFRSRTEAVFGVDKVMGSGNVIEMSNTVDAEVSDDQPELFAEEVINDFVNEVKGIEGPLSLIKKYYSARRKHGELIGRSMAAHILEIGAPTVHGYIGRGRLSDVQIGPMKLVPVNEVLSIWTERHGNGQLVYDRNSKLGGKDGPLTRKQVLQLIGGLEDGWSDDPNSKK
jgi:hypothetical protein